MSDDAGPIEHQELPQRRLPLGELLVMAGVLDRAMLKKALAAQRGRRIRLGALLVEMRALTEQQITQAVAGQLGLHIVDLTQFRPREDALGAVPHSMAKEHGVLPLIIDDATDGGTRLLYAALSDPTNLRATNAIQIHTGLRIRPVMIEESTLVAAIDDYYDAFRRAGGAVEPAHHIPTAVPAVPVMTPQPEPMALDASYLTPVEVAPVDDWSAEPARVEPSFPDVQPMALDASYLTPVEVAPVDGWSAEPARVEPSFPDVQPMALDASHLAPVEVAPVEAAPVDGWAAEPARVEPSFSDVQPMALDASSLTPLEVAPDARADASLFAPAPTSFDAWPDAAPPSAPVDDGRALALDTGPGALELDMSQGALELDLSGRGAVESAPVVVDAREIELPAVAPMTTTADPFDARLPMGTLPTDEGLEELDEVDDADVSPLSDEADPIDMPALASELPAVSVDPFFSDPLPSEIVTLAPDQLRSLISAAMERGSIDPSDVAAVVGAGDDG